VCVIHASRLSTPQEKPWRPEKTNRSAHRPETSPHRRFDFISVETDKYQASRPVGRAQLALLPSPVVSGFSPPRGRFVDTTPTPESAPKPDERRAEPPTSPDESAALRDDLNDLDLFARLT
jgi:hypothetical protein